RRRGRPAASAGRALAATAARPRRPRSAAPRRAPGWRSGRDDAWVSGGRVGQAHGLRPGGGACGHCTHRAPPVGLAVSLPHCTVATVPHPYQGCGIPNNRRSPPACLRRSPPAKDALMHILALDVGTSSVKATRLDVERAAPAGPVARAAYELDHPTPDAAVIPPERLWHALMTAAREASQGSGGRGVDGVGLSSLTPALVLLDEADQPLPPTRPPPPPPPPPAAP